MLGVSLPKFDHAIDAISPGESGGFAEQVAVYIRCHDGIPAARALGQSAYHRAGAATDFQDGLSGLKLGLIDKLMDDAHVARLCARFEMRHHPQSCAAQGDGAEMFAERWYQRLPLRRREGERHEH